MGQGTFPDFIQLADIWLISCAKLFKAPLLFLLIFQNERKISGCKNYILMLLILLALPLFRAKIKSCCDFPFF